MKTSLQQIGRGCFSVVVFFARRFWKDCCCERRRVIGPRGAKRRGRRLVARTDGHSLRALWLVSNIAPPPTALLWLTFKPNDRHKRRIRIYRSRSRSQTRHSRKTQCWLSIKYWSGSAVKSLTQIIIMMMRIIITTPLIIAIKTTIMII